MIQQINDLIKRNRRIIDYLFWGGMTTLVSWGSYSLFYKILNNINMNGFSFWGRKIDTQILLSNILSWICAVLFAFITNKLWVFRSKSMKPSVVINEAVKFVSARIATGIFEIVAVPLLVALGLNQSVFGVNGMVAKIVVSIVVVVLNYILSILFVFAKS